jgi:hypothetical protein
VSHQDFSRFFSKQQKITLYFNNDLILLIDENTNQKTIKRVFATKRPVSLCHPDLNLSSPWELFSISGQIDSSCVTLPPLHWHMGNSNDTCKSFPMWPVPEIIHSRNMVKPENYSLIPIDTIPTAYFLDIVSARILIIDEMVAIDGKFPELLFEKVDIVIISVPSAVYTESIRKKLRPRICISTAESPAEPPASNIVFTNGRTCTIELRITSGKSIEVLNRK